MASDELKYEPYDEGLDGNLVVSFFAEGYQSLSAVWKDLTKNINRTFVS